MIQNNVLDWIKQANMKLLESHLNLILNMLLKIRAKQEVSLHELN